MKKMVLGMLCLALFACNQSKKEIAQEHEEAANAKIVSTFLEKQKSNIVSLEGKNAVSELQSNLLISETTVRKGGNGNKVMITPLSGIDQAAKNDGSSTFLLLSLNTDGSVSKGNIVTYTPVSGSATDKVPEDFFEKYFGDGKVPDVNLKFSSLTGRPLFESVFRNGNVIKHSVPAKKNKVKDASNSANQECVDWYWQTYENGVLVNEQYLFSTCGPYVEEGSGGGTAENGPAEVEVVRYPQWTVLQNPRPGSNGVGEIKSYEVLRGKRSSAYPGGGYFIKNDHSWSYCNFCQQDSDIWSETNSSNTYASALATTTVYGDLHYLGDNYNNLQGTKTWTFSQAFD